MPNSLTPAQEAARIVADYDTLCLKSKSYPLHLEILQLTIATALTARERQVWGKAIAQVALIGTQRDPNGDKHTVVTTIQEFRRRTQALGKISS